jgi:hypothetical protein
VLVVGDSLEVGTSPYLRGLLHGIPLTGSDQPPQLNRGGRPAFPRRAALWDAVSWVRPHNRASTTNPATRG